MKNQYFGDVNDFRKYGLLRALTGRGEISTAVCWMLTPDDGRTDGQFTTYLTQPERWRHYDSELYDQLREAVAIQGRRDVRYVEEVGLLPSTRFYDELLHDDAGSRENYFETFWQVSKGCDLVFFDPDNGLEVKSKPYGKRDSCKYLYWRELEKAVASGHSVLVYQHFRRVQRDRFIEQMVQEIGEHTGIGIIYSFRTAHVVFFLLLTDQQEAAFEGYIEDVERVWADQFSVIKHICAQPAPEPDPSLQPLRPGLGATEAMYFRNEFREARAKALSNAEEFQEILFVLERFGSYLHGSAEGLYEYRHKIRDVAAISPLAEDIPASFPSWHVPFSQLYYLVRRARNDALHQGALARHLTRNAVQLALILEDALMSSRKSAGDYMVRDPVCASLWQPVSFIRQQMLANSFTYLPVWNSEGWRLVSDYQVALFLRHNVLSRNHRRAKLAMTLEEAVNDGLILEEVCTCLTNASLDEVLELSKGRPVLVVDGERPERLVGIVTPFDLV
jgi:CBS domain-containing protein